MGAPAAVLPAPTDPQPSDGGPRRRVSALQVAGELLLTLGVVVLLFVGWKLWWNDAVIASAQTAAADHRSSGWQAEATTPPRAPVPAAPVVRREPARAGTVIGVLRVPRFGASYARTIAQGTGTAELSTFELGVGHYPGTQMPGQIGNFAIAGHRSAYGGAMHLIDRLRPGDRIVVETKDGWYTYRFDAKRIVQPTAIDAIDAVPFEPKAVPTTRMITLTTCTPLYSTAQRWVATGSFVSFRPRVAR